MIPVIGQFLSPAIGVALSPVPLIAILVLIFTRRGRLNSVAFTIGWMLGIAIVLSLVLALGIEIDQDRSPTSTMGWVQLVMGVLFLIVASRQFASRPRPGEPVTEPKWMAAIDDAGPVMVAGIAALLAGINAKNTPLIIATALDISAADLGIGSDIVLSLIFLLLGSSSVLVLVVAYLAFGDRISDTLIGIRRWLQGNSAVIMMVLFGLLGIQALGRGLSILAG